MFPLIPLSYFVHGPAIDYALAAALTLHIHWGVQVSECGPGEKMRLW